MLGSEGGSLSLRDIITARRMRRARVRRQEVVVIDGDVTSDDDNKSGSDSDSEDEDDDKSKQPKQPGQPTPTSKSERVIPTLTAITHSPRPIPSKVTNQDSPARTTLSTSTTNKAGYTPPAVEAGVQASPTIDYPSATTGKVILVTGPTRVADSDGNVVSVTTGDRGGGLSSGAKAGIAVGVIGKF